MPLWLQRAFFTPLVKLARWRKVERTFGRYPYAGGTPPIGQDVCGESKGTIMPTSLLGEPFTDTR